MAKDYDINESTASKPEVAKPKAWESALAMSVFFATLFPTMSFFTAHTAMCYLSPWSYSALPFVVLSIGITASSMASSFLPGLVRQNAAHYPSDDGRSEWHSRMLFRYSALSNLGYGLMIWAVALAFDYENGTRWQHFGWVFGAGLCLVLMSGLLLWYRHPPFRDMSVRANSLVASLFFVLLSMSLVKWVYAPFYIEPVAVLLLFYLSCLLAGIIFGLQENRRRKRLLEKE